MIYSESRLMYDFSLKDPGQVIHYPCEDKGKEHRVQSTGPPSSPQIPGAKVDGAEVPPTARLRREGRALGGLVPGM